MRALEARQLRRVAVQSAGALKGLSMLRLVSLVLFLPALAGVAAERPWFGIRVVDEQTGRGVPMVELETVHHVRCFTDSAGWVAFYEPGLMGSNVFFHVRSHGYEFPADGFGNRGKRLKVTPGGEAVLRIKRLNVAERLYRLTGGGIYRDSVLLGRPTPIKRPVLNGSVLGQDSVNAIAYRGRIWWFWGDTDQPAYPLGNFHTSGAVSELPLKPDRGIDLNYFVNDKGFSRPMVPMPGGGVVWIFGLTVLKDARGQERMIAHYQRMKNLETMLEHGLVVYNDSKEVFEKWVAFDLKRQWQALQNHPTRWRSGGRDYCLIPRPLPNVRVPAQMNAVADQDQYEAFTCLKAGATMDGARTRLDRDAAGRPRYSWKKNTPPVGPKEERLLIRHGLMDHSDARFLPVDVESGEVVVLHFATARWNAFRRKWILIGTQIGGKSSFLGEVWYAEADQPTGPWKKARKVVTHDHYSFYNPCHHDFLDEAGGRLIYFEGTYTSTFSSARSRTPRYDYNQILYRLDLADPRLRPLRSD